MAIRFQNLKNQWAWQDSNYPADSAEKQPISEPSAVKSAANAGTSAFSDAIQSIMQLPLTDAEKADAVRRLLAHGEPQH